ncbi:MULTISPECIES: glycosyltransferase [unclassified Oceanispirochaeta]|uniref:glycosyltransferase n=1 Tax=unclassified Oceanispirochaeta TaxID=2635722 RepID=UPI000E0950BE|nr:MULTISPECIES: glycosyltransferase [unclassified Oceanispirochaeta]MBF9017751.1 glycosyltransferase [Oceanispirochaeta sp. M2]NPD74315.1 glycosyltransferase [Oceanispirochaeta sp. M1]RDG29796.1 glycosyltransferase [Oceanispirochaeta sp. M1]
MKITFIGYTIKRGGAGKAALRMYNALDKSGVEREFITIENNSLYSAKDNKYIEKYIHLIGWITSYLICKFQKTKNITKHSLNIFGSSFIKRQVSEASLLHIHWINNESLRIKDFYLLSNKSVITLHDEWFYCGAEHLALDDETFKRVIEGYSFVNKNVKGIDINRFIWNIKKQNYKLLSGVIFTVPSSWMKDRAQQSNLLKNRDIRIVPNPIDTSIFKKQKDLDYPYYGILKNNFIITFGAVKGSISNIKGFDLLISAIEKISIYLDDISMLKIITFGGKVKKKSTIFGIDVIEVGHISSESELAEIYSLSSITVVPSRVESFGQVAAESLSCETPVVGFDHSGLKDIIIHKKNGFLATPFEPDSLAEGILWFYNMSKTKLCHIGECGRSHIELNFSNKIVSEKMISIYNEIEGNL